MNQVKAYDFSSLLSPQDNLDIKTISQQIIAEGRYFKNSPKYQTQENLFARPEPVWLKMRQSFIFGCFLYLDKEVRIKNIMSWVFMTSAKDAEDRDKLWHNHHINDNDGTTSTLSGVWYVSIPNDVSNPKLTGTEFCPNWPDHNLNFFQEPKDLTWFIYSSKLWHRPGITDSDDCRFVFAADMEYFL